MLSFTKFMQFDIEILPFHLQNDLLVHFIETVVLNNLHLDMKIGFLSYKEPLSDIVN